MIAVEADRLAELVAACSNTSRWGADDQLGTLNLITPETRRRAARLVAEGISISMASDLSPQHTPATDSLERHAAYVDPAAPFAVADTVTLQVHGWSTHLDALGHIYNDGVGYNGRRKDDVFSPDGLAANAITSMRDGVFTRGVLLDVAAACGVAWLPAGHVITPQEIGRAEEAAGLHVEPGDALFLYTGLSERLAGEDAADSDHRAGVGVEAVLWMRQCDIALFGGDCVDVLPGLDPDLPLPLHQLGVAAIGLALLDWPDLGRLLATCRQLARWEFLLTVAPLRIVGGTGSPVNPIATF
jgi:kynurenine formamidase